MYAAVVPVSAAAPMAAPYIHMEGEVQAIRGQTPKLARTALAGETAGRGTEMMTARSSVAAAFSSSSLSLPASVDTFSAVLHLSVPQFIAKSPSLVKANQAVAEATAIREPVPPCLFTLRGKRQTRERNEIQHEGNTGGGRAATANSPRRPPYRVDTGEGYSPRLRMLGREGYAYGEKTATATAEPVNEPLSPVLTEPVSPASRSCAADIGTNDAAACGSTAAVDTAYSPVISCSVSSYPCRDKETLRDRDLPVVSDPETNETATNAWRGNQARTKVLGPLHTRERPMTTSRTDCACGRLWTGTTSAKPDAVRPRTLFLVSGQQQRIKNTARKRYSETRRHQHLHVDPIVVAPPPPAKTRHTKSVPPVRREATVSARWRSRSASCDDVRTDQDGDNRGRGGGASDCIPSPGSTSGFGAADGECYDAATTAATDGKGDDSAKKVLHVRVPHPPPTSLLILRPAPPTA